MMKRIVVGLIDTPAARAALHWAARQAATTGALVEVVTCIQPLPSFAWSESFAVAAPPLITVGGLRAEAARLQERVLREEFGPRVGAVPIRATIVAGEAATSLAGVAADADLVAVGRPRHRRFLRRSVGDRCAHLFEGPVVLVPAGDDGGGKDWDRDRAAVIEQVAASGT